MSGVDVRLEPIAQGLHAVQINGRTIEVLPRYAGIAERASRNHGALFTAEDLRGEVRSRDVLQRLPGVQVNDRSVTFARCQDSGTLPGPFGGFGGNPPRVQVYVDGFRVTAEQGVSGDLGAILDNVNPSAIALMEVYTGIARIPGEFVNDACAVIAIWTKAY